MSLFTCHGRTTEDMKVHRNPRLTYVSAYDATSIREVSGRRQALSSDNLFVFAVLIAK